LINLLPQRIHIVVLVSANKRKFLLENLLARKIQPALNMESI
jgi:hypothetical protein